MTPTHLFRRYLWLVELLANGSRLTKAEIDKKWEKSHLNKAGEKVIPRQTFIRMLDAIEKIFNINITCDRKNRNVYYIPEGLNDQMDGCRRFLLSGFAINQLVIDNQDLRPRILMESAATGSNEFLEKIITAMRNNRRVRIVYKSYKMHAAREFDIDPYAIRYFEQRWYLLAHTEFHQPLWLYALDRMNSVSITEERFSLPEEFSAIDYFSRFYGIMVTDAEMETICIKTNEFRAAYLRSLPLHHSQKECAPGIFELRLVPTEEFKQTLRAIGPDIEILEPQWLRKVFQDEAAELVKKYRKKR